MKNFIVVYYSNNGSNNYLSHKIADKLGCEIVEIAPRLRIKLLLMLGMNWGNKTLDCDLKEYEKVILCGPIWMGGLIVPLKNFINKYKKDINKLAFVTSCASSFEEKNSKFGHNLVFDEVKKMMGDKCICCEAFPMPLILDDEQKQDADLVMKTRLSDENFNGEILDIFNKFIAFIAE